MVSPRFTMYNVYGITMIEMAQLMLRLIWAVTIIVLSCEPQLTKQP
jgi:hypothetical protein